MVVPKLQANVRYTKLSTSGQERARLWIFYLSGIWRKTDLSIQICLDFFFFFASLVLKLTGCQSPVIVPQNPHSHHSVLWVVDLKSLCTAKALCLRDRRIKNRWVFSHSPNKLLIKSWCRSWMYHKEHTDREEIHFAMVTDRTIYSKKKKGAHLNMV